MILSEFERFLNEFAAAVETAMQDGLPKALAQLSEAHAWATDTAEDSPGLMTIHYRYETAARLLVRRFTTAGHAEDLFEPSYVPRPWAEETKRHSFRN